MYEVLYKDMPVFKIGIENGERGKCNILDERHLPYDIYLTEEDDFDSRFDNYTNFNCWCEARILPLDREYAKNILNYFGFTQETSDAERAKIGIATRCLSLNDCYWLKNENEKLTWKDVNLFTNSLQDVVFEIALFGKTPTVTNSELIPPDVSTDGQAAKAWLRAGDGFYLLKGDKNDSVTKETEASQILTKLGIWNAGYIKSEFKGEPVSKCKCFTDENTNFVRAKWFAIWCMNHDESIADYIALNQEQFDRMNLADFLVGNMDEHSMNWGFLYDNNMNILSLNPLMDYDHAFEAGPNIQCLPAQLLGETITQWEMAVRIVKEHPDWIPSDIDLSGYKYGQFVQERIDMLTKELMLGDRKSPKLDTDDIER